MIGPIVGVFLVSAMAGSVAYGLRLSLAEYRALCAHNRRVQRARREGRRRRVRVYSGKVVGSRVE